MQRPTVCFLGRSICFYYPLDSAMSEQGVPSPAYAAPLQLLNFPLPRLNYEMHGYWKEGCSYQVPEVGFGNAAIRKTDTG